MELDNYKEEYKKKVIADITKEVHEFIIESFYSTKKTEKRRAIIAVCKQMNFNELSLNLLRNIDVKI